ncbi:MAG TPA: 2-oxoacid:acceptor oxidoreductase subunit alpha, partial [Actinomycetota bacterium]|nr:2-oxoacid:acceptor oxidoreductase subunit alpha [Actinomycetota bacterium]
DEPNVLVAMNPAALKANIKDLEKGGVIIANEDAFLERNLEKAGYSSNPLDDGSLDAYQVFRVPMTSITLRATEGMEVTKKEAERAKNFFALGLVSWMYGRPTDVTMRWIEKKFGKKPAIKEGNLAAFKAGYNFGETTELFAHTYEIKPATVTPGVYRNVSGNTALSWGLVAASVKSGVPIFYASYPITPASELLHELSRHKNFGVRTLQAEDEIAAAGAAVGAAFGGQIGVTGTSGPGLDLKQETIGLAVALELPMVIVDIQRAGPSTGMPTKTEAADLLAAMWGRHGESPIPIVASYTPAQCFDAAIEAVRIAVKYRTPVILLSDTFLGNSSEPWRLPNTDKLPEIQPRFATQPNHDDGFMPYLRDENLSRPWAVPGTPGLVHRIGGLEKEDVTGDISYEAANHERMTHLRAAKVAKIADDIPVLEVDDRDGDAQLLVLGWGSTYGSIKAAVRRVREAGRKVASAHLTHLNPLPKNIREVLAKYPKVLIPELNTGQLLKIIRAEFLVAAEGYSKVQGQPFQTGEIEHEMLKRV